LDATNVRSAIEQVTPWAVDVSGGVEDPPGVKNPQLVSEFIALAKHSYNPSSVGE
jgi:phosphoribosylanthranilate isomerase